jgi:hypothetical protein
MLGVLSDRTIPLKWLMSNVKCAMGQAEIILQILNPATDKSPRLLAFIVTPAIKARILIMQHIIPGLHIKL